MYQTQKIILFALCICTVVVFKACFSYCEQYIELLYYPSLQHPLVTKAKTFVRSDIYLDIYT